MTLMVVRHGESEGNVQGVTQGWLDSPLSERGRLHAAAAAERLGVLGVAAVYSSDLSRASETAEIIASTLGLPVEQRADLREQCFGERQGMTWARAVKRWGPRLRVGSGLIPGEESFPDFRARVAREFDLLAERHREDTAIVVTHGGTVRMIVGHVLGLPPEVYPDFHVGNGSITEFATDGPAPHIVSLNDGCHLREGGLLASGPG